MSVISFIRSDKTLMSEIKDVCIGLDRELIHTAMAGIKLAMAAGDMDAGGDDYLRKLALLLPSKCHVFPLVVQRLTRLVLDGETIAALHIFYTSVDFGRNLIFLARSEIQTDDSIRVNIATSWLRICQQAKTALA